MNGLKKKKAYIIFLLVLFSLLVICVIRVTVEKNDKQKQITENRLELYRRVLYMDGEFTRKGNTVVIHDRSYDEKEMIQDVALYNAFYPDDPIRIEMLMEEFDLFCDGMKESALIETYHERMKALKVRAEDVELFVYSYDYDRVVIKYLKEMYDTRLADATVEQMRVVCPYAAADFYNEVIKREENR